MAIVAPFKGLRFNPEKISNLEEVVTPPYDVISEEDGAKFLEKNIYNMIQLDLRNTSQDSSGNEDRYRTARNLFESWVNSGILVRDDQPAMYLYSINYTHPSGRKLTRTGLICLVELAEFSEGIVKPHEKTFETVVVDRMRLMNECRAQFSKVFSIYRDDGQTVVKTLERAKDPNPLCIIRDHLGNTHTLWRVTDRRAIDTIIRFFAGQPVYIADGHHRYTTALGYRNSELRKNPSLRPDSPYNFIMMYLCAAEDEGLSILPTHRLLTFPGKLTADECMALMSEALHIEEINGASREVLIAEVLARMNEWEMTSSEPVFGLYHAGEDRCFLLTLMEPREKYPVLAGIRKVLRELDVVVLSELLIHQLIGIEHKRIIDEKLMSYFSDPDEALDVAVKKSVDNDRSTPLLFLLNPTRVHQVVSVADSGEYMPHKSTYFFPKILTGLMINRLVAGEKIYMAGQAD
jgi:uncharacterized protein (DUF1015 family)